MEPLKETVMERELIIGDVVVFINKHRMEQKALITAIHGDPRGRQMTPRRKAVKDCSEEELSKLKPDLHDLYAYEVDEDGKHVYDYAEPGQRWPCINLVIVAPNTECKDPYGRQLERHSSVVHQTDSSAIGYCYRFVDERIKTELRQPTIS
jgi:hypothetical protein